MPRKQGERSGSELRSLSERWGNRDSYEQWLIEEDQLRRFCDLDGPAEQAEAEPMSPGDAAAVLARVPSFEELESAIQDGASRQGANPSSAAVLDEACRAIRDREATKAARRGRLVAMLARAKSAEPANDVGNDAEIVRALRDIEPALAGRDEREILAAYRRALSTGNSPKRMAAKLSVELNMFGDRGVLPAAASAPEISKAINRAEDAFGSAERREKNREKNSEKKCTG